MTQTTKSLRAMCSYIGHTGTQPTCSRTATHNSSYCTEHYSLVYQVGTARARRHKDLRVAVQTWDVMSAFHEAVEELTAEGYDIEEDRWQVEEAEEA